MEGGVAEIVRSKGKEREPTSFNTGGEGERKRKTAVSRNAKLKSKFCQTDTQGKKKRDEALL